MSHLNGTVSHMDKKPSGFSQTIGIVSETERAEISHLSVAHCFSFVIDSTGHRGHHDIMGNDILILKNV